MNPLVELDVDSIICFRVVSQSLLCFQNQLTSQHSQVIMLLTINCLENKTNVSNINAHLMEPYF